jgi:hypothetical protein
LKRFRPAGTDQVEEEESSFIGSQFNVLLKFLLRDKKRIFSSYIRNLGN